jgi:CubicO group peptidase (beta-lactamase class C family)
MKICLCFALSALVLCTTAPLFSAEHGQTQRPSKTTSATPATIAAFKAHFNDTLTQHGVAGGAYALTVADVPSDSASSVELIYDSNLDTAHPIDRNTAYNWASITKTMTAIAIMQLRDRGKLSLDDPAVRYIPELHEAHDAYGPIDAITIRQLLTHSAGFRNPTWPWECDQANHCEWEPFEPTHWSQVAAMLPYTHIDFAPGTRWAYSNLGYVFLGQIIERLSGDDYEVYIDKNILKPLEMYATYFDRAPYFLASHVSASYIRHGSKLEAQPFDYDTGITTSNSGLKSPITDMEKYLCFLIGDPTNKLYEIVLKRASLEEMWFGTLPTVEEGQPATAYTSGPHGAVPHMGLGFFVLEVNGRKLVYHDGDQGGFSSEMLIDPAHHLASILVVNTTDSGEAPPADTSHPHSNTEPDFHTDLRQTLRAIELDQLFPAIENQSK